MGLADLSGTLKLHSVRHRTPRYVYNRTRLLLSERRNPDDPWLTPRSVDLLDSMLRQSDRGAEFGSGRSTIWFATRTEGLTSIEHNERWYSTVSAQLKDKGLTNVNYIFAPCDQPRERGLLSKYTCTALDFADASVDYALVDGLYRDHIAKAMIPKVKPGGLLIIDDVNWYLPSLSRSPASRTPKLGPDGPVWAEVDEELRSWRMIWTTSGVSDTAIFIKQ